MAFDRLKCAFIVHLFANFLQICIKDLKFRILVVSL